MASYEHPYWDLPELTGQEHRGTSLSEFANVLSNGAPELFGSTWDVFDTLSRIERIVQQVEPTMRVTSMCTFTASNPKCWALNRQQQWNSLFNHRGVELAQLQNGTFHFRTMNFNLEDIVATGEDLFICLYLWLLRQHRCISSVSVSLAIVTSRCWSLVMRVLQFTDYVQKLEIHGKEPLGGQSHATLTSSDSESSSHIGDDPWENKLDCLYQLRELGLSTVHFGDDGSEALIRCVQRNTHLVALILIDVEMNVAAFKNLIERVVKLEELQDLRIKVITTEENATFERALSLVGRSSSLLRLYVHAQCGLENLLVGLRSNETIEELSLEPKIGSANVLAQLGVFLEEHPCCQRVKFSADFSLMGDAPDPVSSLGRIIRTTSLQTLVLSGSTVDLSQSLSIADALAESNLKELHLDCCGIHCDAIPRFIASIKGLKDPKSLKELNLGAVIGTAQQQREMFKLIRRSGVRPLITLVYSDSLMDTFTEWHHTDRDMSGFVKLSLSFAEDATIDHVLHSLKSAPGSLESLSIDTERVISQTGTAFLAQVIRQNKSLKVLQIRCPTTSYTSILLLQALAESRSVIHLTIESWDLSERVAPAFAEMLRENRSLYRLEIYWTHDVEYQRFAAHLADGLSSSMSVGIVKMYQGERSDVVSLIHSPSLLRLQKNELALFTAIEDVLMHHKRREGIAIADLLDICDMPVQWPMLTTDFGPRTASNLVRHARMATRVQYYALRSAFPGALNFRVALEAHVDAQELILRTRGSIERLGHEAAPRW